MHVETIEVKIGDIWMTPEEPFQEVKQAVDLSKAEVIVAIGRGIKGKENIALAEKLAEVLGGAAASRPICDAEWLPIDPANRIFRQTVALKLYIALGISGAIQHFGRYEKLGNDCRYQQGSGSLNFRYSRLRHRGRSF